MYETGLFLFHRDLRIIDNTGLLLANSKCKAIIPIFIFTPEQVTNKNPYKSDNAIQFMLESLAELEQEIKKSGGHLLFFYGHTTDIVKQCIQRFQVDYVCFNADYSPYALKRDKELSDMCDKLDISCESASDYYLHDPGSIVNGSKQPYKKFTPYYNTALKLSISPPAASRKIHFSAKTSTTFSLKEAYKKFCTSENDQLAVHGSRNVALRLLKQSLTGYSKTHDNLALETSQLSAPIKFGCISIREVYKAFRSNKDFIRQLHWRDFYANILYSFPHVLGKPMKPSYSKVKWHHNTRWFESWKKGQTGFPAVDAGMRQLNETGYMHNRARLIVACFLTKTLLIDWRYGEKYFATQLTDYDPASNNGNWQWVASTGADSQPYFRIFNPWSQSVEHDPDAEYIKKWVPELNAVITKDIHQWNTAYTKYPGIKYGKPICDYSEQKEKALAMYKSIV